MADQKTQLDVLVGVQGTEKLRGLTNAVKGLQQSQVLADKSSRKLLLNLKKQSSSASKTINGTRALADSYRQLANSVSIGSREFKLASRRADELDRKLKRMQATSRKGFGGKARGLARGIGAVAAGGIFGGAEGAIGGGIGLIAGGAPGAVVGAAVGAQVGMARQQIGEIAAFSAQLKLQREALRLVVADTEKFNKAQKFLQKTSKELAIPQNLITRQFTSLTASVTGAGKSVADAEEVFRAIASGIRGTGGSLEDMRAAMVATSQVFSKGKVSAEELRQQLGERLPGAFTLFAESMNKTPAELDKALEQGKVTLDDIMCFAEHLFNKYGENAKILADSPAAAGDRLTTAMTELKDNVGQLLQPIGSEFQDTFTKIVEAINPAIKSFVEFTNKLKIENLKLEIEELEKTLKRGFKVVGSGSVTGGIPKNIEDDEKEKLKAELLILKDKLDVLTGIKKETENITEETKNLNQKSKIVFDSLKAGAQDYLNSIKDVGKQIQDAFVSAFKGMEDAFVNFVMTGKLNFKDLARSIIADITRIVVRQKLMMPLLKGVNNIFGLDLKFNAAGNVFGANGIIPYAKGGIVNKPTIFPFANGVGLMGEAGAEAILPLKRGRSGNLGVESSGTSTNIVVNVDASGSSVEGSNENANQFGEQLASAIQAVIINEKRSGGLLN